jgi:hypothetical protein
VFEEELQVLYGHDSAIKPLNGLEYAKGSQPYPLINGDSGLPLPPSKCGPPFPHQGRELSGRAAGSAEKAEAEAVKDPTAATRWSERLHTARLEVRTLSAAPQLKGLSLGWDSIDENAS